MRFIYTKTFRWAFLVFGVVALFIVADATNSLTAGKSAVLRSYGSGAVLARGWGEGIKRAVQTFILIKNLSRANDGLRQQVDALAFENARLKAAKQENSALRRALGFAEDTSWNAIPVEVIMADLTGLSQTVIIDRGSADQLTEGLAVIVNPGLLAGRISKVYARSAEVTLITDPGLMVSAEVTETKASGLVSGAHGLGLKFDLVTHNELIKVGDQLITSGLAGDFPRGLLIGEIGSINAAASDLFVQASVIPAADLRRLKFLFVIRP